MRHWNLVILAVIALTAGVVLAQVGERYVSASALNLRMRPSADAVKLTSLLRGTKVDVAECTNGWCNVSTRIPCERHPVEECEAGDLLPIKGWVSERFLSRSAPQAQQPTRGLAVGKRMEIYRALVREQDKWYCRGYGNTKDREAYRIIARRYGISVSKVEEIAVEGSKKLWPIPDSPCE